MTPRTRYFMFGSVAFLLVGLCTGVVAFYSGLPMGAFGQQNAPTELSYVPAGAAVVPVQLAPIRRPPPWHAAKPRRRCVPSPCSRADRETPRVSHRGGHRSERRISSCYSCFPYRACPAGCGTLTVTTVPAIDAEVAPSITATPVGAGPGGIILDIPPRSPPWPRSHRATASTPVAP